MSKLQRRTFLAGAAVAVAGARILRAAGANARVNIASVGVGGKGWSDARNATAAGAHMVAFCDVDQNGTRRGGFRAAAREWPGARPYTDWREMLDKEHKNLDGVTISTPDHMHAPITMAAMRRGLAVYTQKPLTRTIFESRQLTLAAAKNNVVTQMGNQGHNGKTYQQLVELVRSGAIGPVLHAHAWSNRPIWPQGNSRPKGQAKPPASLNWDHWLGVAPARPYLDKTYHPFNWRGWYDFGAGALGDMGCHILDPIVWSLELQAPVSVSANCEGVSREMFPSKETLSYVFPPTKHTIKSPFTVTWYDGGRLPAQDVTPLLKGVKLKNQGLLLVGAKGAILSAHSSTADVTLLPEKGYAGFKLPQAAGRDHTAQWVNAIAGNGATTSSFDYAGPLTETVLLGTVAARFPGETLKWDSKSLEFTGHQAATSLVKPVYRKGWEDKELTG